MWGMRESRRQHYAQNILGVHTVLPQILALFERYGVRATWATVGALACPHREDLKARIAALSSEVSNPQYYDNLRRYIAANVGNDEREDPLHFGGSLVQRILDSAGQDLGTHTLTHYPLLECPDKQAFIGDLRSGMQVLQESGAEVRSLVFPRNQVQTGILAEARALGLRTYRGTGESSSERWRAPGPAQRWHRGIRLMGAYLPIGQTQFKSESSAGEEQTMMDIPGSRFLRPLSRQSAAVHALHLLRVKNEMAAAARQGLSYHLWWHPHNFGQHSERHLKALETLLEQYRHLNDRFGWQSRNMNDVGLEAGQP